MGQKSLILIIRCPSCNKIKRHGEWVVLTTRETLLLTERKDELQFYPELCPLCAQTASSIPINQ